MAMPPLGPARQARTVLQKALSLGASAAGVVSLDAVRALPLHPRHVTADWPDAARSVVVLALEHPPGDPALDWWDNRPGKTPGNRRLRKAAKRLAAWLERSLGTSAWNLPYAIEDGGLFLKDAAALAGLGVIGRNNLLITPAFGPRVRLRALLIDQELPTGGLPDGFNPCTGCDAPCRGACPQEAFRGGAYDLDLCQRQMAADEANPFRVMDVTSMTYSIHCIKYCRACELACPVGR
jgi:epoxyqueuosine reductase